MTTNLRTTAIVVLLLVVNLFHPQLMSGQTQKPTRTKVQPTRHWSGAVPDKELEEEKPDNGLIVSQKAFEKLWKAWRTDEKIPSVDFEKEFVVVLTSRKDELLNLLGGRDPKGDLEIVRIITGKERKGAGFAYAIATFQREGITSVSGKELPKQKCGSPLGG